MVALMIPFLLIILASCYILASHVIRHLKLPNALNQKAAPDLPRKRLCATIPLAFSWAFQE